MKANRAARAASPGGEGVSSVVAAVLMFVLFTSVFVLWVVQTLPEWEADREHNHQRTVRGELGGLKSALEGLSARRDPGPVTAVVPLGTPPVPVVQATPAHGDLDLLGGAQGLATTLEFPATPAVFLSDGVAVSAPTAPTATPPCPAATPRCVEALSALVAGIATSGVNGAASATLTVTVADSAVPPATVTAAVTHHGSGPDCDGEVRLVAAGTPFPLLCGVGGTLGTAASPYRVDLLEPAYGFSAAVGRLQAPLAVTFSTSASGGAAGFAASAYTAVWQDVGGIEKAVGTGVANARPVPDQSGARLVFTPHYLQHPSQQLSFEGGAVLALEPGGAQAVAVEPSFALRTSGGTGYLRWTLVHLAGSGSLSGTQEATVQLTHRSTQDLVLVTPAACSPCAQIGLDTPAGPGWNSFFSARALASGAGASAVAGSGAAGSLTLSSGAGQPVTDGWVLHLRVIQAEASVS